jgi:hypothetical protein
MISGKANVTSVDALKAFRASLIIYVSKARPALEEVSADVQRMRSWLENDQRTHWENQLRRRLKELEQAQQALFSAKIGNLRDESTAERFAFNRAKREVDEAQTKLRILKKWTRDFDGKVDPLVKQTEKLHTVLANDMVRAIAYLAEAIDTLEAYAGSPVPSSNSAPASGEASGGHPSAENPVAEKGANA